MRNYSPRKGIVVGINNGRYVRVLILLLICGLTSCFDSEDLIGQKKVQGSENLYVKIYQTNDWEHVSGILYELLNEKDSIIKRKAFVTGTYDRPSHIEDYGPFLVDSIFYLCYPYPEVYVIYPLDTSQLNLPRETLFKKLKEHDSTLIDDWQR